MHVKHVWASPGGGEPEVGHIVRSAYENEAGETKSDVFADGAVHALAFRDPADFDENGYGGCFWNIVDVEGSNRS
jgi:hypothetical protein